MTTSLMVTEIQRKIFLIRGQHVVLDSHLAESYGIETKILNKTVFRNRSSFPQHLVFRLNQREFDELKLSNEDSRSSWGGHRKYLPLVYSEEAIRTLSAILNNEQAKQANVLILQAFAELRQTQNSYPALQQDIHDLRKMLEHMVAGQAEILRRLDSRLGGTSRENPKKLITYESPRLAQVEEIQQASAKYFDVKPQDLKLNSRTQKIALARQVAMYLCRKSTGLGLKQIAQYFDRSDHTTVMHACKKIEAALQADSEIKCAVEIIELSLVRN